MRHYIDIVEAAAPGSATYWFNPKTKQVITASDHGTAVMEMPEIFHIDDDIVSQMEEAFPYGSEDNEMEDSEEVIDITKLPPPPDEIWGDRNGWNRNDAWEVLGMNRGWVRVGGWSGYNSSYCSGVNEEVVWHALNFITEIGAFHGAIEVEICRPQNSLFGKIYDDDLDKILKAGPKRGAVLIAKALQGNA